MKTRAALEGHIDSPIEATEMNSSLGVNQAGQLAPGSAKE
jgi:hypothetical protein